MNQTERIETLHLFPRLDALLIDLLRGLTPQEWSLPTICSAWDVKDIAAHLLDGNIRRLSVQRDHHLGIDSGEIASYEDLVGFLNGLNADWVRAMRRMSPRIITELLEKSGAELHDLLCSLDPSEPSLYPVAWAGEEVSENWFDIAREYTERWLHQQQIRLATGRTPITTPELYLPLLETFMRALPHTYREVEAPEGTRLLFRVTGETEGTWALVRSGDGWHQEAFNADTEYAATVTIPGEYAWRIFSRGIDRASARGAIVIEGDGHLVEKVLDMLSVMA